MFHVTQLKAKEHFHVFQSHVAPSILLVMEIYRPKMISYSTYNPVLPILLLCLIELLRRRRPSFQFGGSPNKNLLEERLKTRGTDSVTLIVFLVKQQTGHIRRIKF